MKKADNRIQQNCASQIEADVSVVLLTWVAVDIGRKYEIFGRFVSAVH